MRLISGQSSGINKGFATGIEIWDLKTGNLIKYILATLEVESYDNIPYPANCILKINNSQLAIGIYEDIKIIDINSEFSYILNFHNKSVTCLVKLNNNQIASGSRDKDIVIWDLNEKMRKKVLGGHTENVINLIRLGECWIISGSEDKSIKVWDKQLIII